MSTIDAKWRCRASGCSELLARQRRSFGGTGRWRRTTPAWRLGVCVVGGVADGQCGDVMVSRAGWATVAATGVRATTVGQRRGAWANDDDDDEERTAANGNVLASATVVEVRRVAARRGRRAARAGNAVDVADGRHEGDGRSTCGTSARRRVGGSGARSSRRKEEEEEVGRWRARDACAAA